MLIEFIESVEKEGHDKSNRTLNVKSYIDAYKITALCQEQCGVVIIMNDGSKYYSSERIEDLAERFNGQDY